MKKILVACITTALFGVASATAADMPVKARPVVPAAAPAIGWTGFYIGGHAGYGWSELDWVILPDTDVSHRGRGGLAGGQGGFNWQWNNFVLGVEVDGDWADIKGHAACPNAAFECRHKINSLWTVRGRLGVLVGASRQFLLYGTGGGAWGHAAYEARNLATGSLTGGFANSTTHSGWVGGGGIEYKFAPSWSLKVEYLHYGLTSKTLDCSPQPAVGTTFCAFQPDVETFKVGFNWHFAAR